MQVQVDDGALAGFDDFLLDLVANLGDDLLDAGGVDASILHEFDQRQPRDLPANRIKSGEDDGLGRVVHDDLDAGLRSEEHTSELQSRENLVCRLLLEKKNQ